MARKAREKSSTGKYIIMLRGMEDTIFKAKKTRDLFSELITEKLSENMLGIRFFNDRVVAVVKESEDGVAMDIKPVLISFSRSYNRERGQSGKVFLDRFKSLPIENSEFENQCLHYIKGEKASDPFEQKRARSIPSNKPAQKPKQKKTEKPEPEVKPQQKRRNDMPTWLL